MDVDNTSMGDWKNVFGGTAGTIIGLAYYILLAIAMWKVFTKAGYPGILALIPIVNWFSWALLLAAVVRLAVFTDNLPYRVLGAQPIVATEKRGWFTKLGEALDEFGERLHGTFGRKES